MNNNKKIFINHELYYKQVSNIFKLVKLQWQTKNYLNLEKPKVEKFHMK
jgi:hypothetical protein